MLIDTHAHLYATDFDDDRDIIIKSAISAGVCKVVLPNIDEHSYLPLLELSAEYPDVCYPLIGLHPTSVDGDYKRQLKKVEKWLGDHKFYGIGETGIDLYWDTTYRHEQAESFRIQLRFAREMNLPVIIHVRNSFNEVISAVEKEQDGRLRGIFHCFSGSVPEADIIMQLGFHIGIGGVVTFKNSQLPSTLKKVDIKHVVLETDAPYLAPMPFRGKRNESSYLTYIALKIAEIYGLPLEEVAEITTANARELFGF